MSGRRTRDMMIPLELYATVSEDSTFYDAVLALGTAAKASGQEHHGTPESILVFDKKGRIAGQIDCWDLLRSIEPRYANIGSPREIVGRECSDCEFADSILKTYNLWQESAEELCAKSAKVTVRKMMRPIQTLEYIDEQAPIEEAMNSMIIWRLSLMFVTRSGEVVGVLKLTDVARVALLGITECRLPRARDPGEMSGGKAA